MKTLLIGALMAVFLFLTAEGKDKMVVVAFGDSITQGVIGVKPEENWLRLLGGMLGDGYALINAGVGGNSAREAMARYDRDVLAKKPDLILIEFGGNNHDPGNQKRRVDDTEFKKHLADFKAKVPAGCKVVVITFPPVIDEQHAYGNNPFFPDGLDKACEPQREIVRKFAKDNSYPLVDLHRLMWDRRYEFILKDGVHLNAAGQKFFAEKVYETLKKENMLK